MSGSEKRHKVDLFNSFNREENCLTSLTYITSADILMTSSFYSADILISHNIFWFTGSNAHNRFTQMHMLKFDRSIICLSNKVMCKNNSVNIWQACWQYQTTNIKQVIRLIMIILNIYWYIYTSVQLNISRENVNNSKNCCLNNISRSTEMWNFEIEIQKDN